MSCKELIESLRASAGERTRTLWAEAEQDAAACRQQNALRLEQLRSRLDRARIASRTDATSAAMAEARNRGRAAMLSAYRALSDKLYQTARSSLPTLRRNDPDRLFRALAQELPAQDWETVRVNPADAELARTLFPKAEIVRDASISGGLEVSAGGGSIRVVNTLEKRLERAWSDLLPALIREVEQGISDGSPSA